MTATHNVPNETPPETYQEKAAKRRTRRQEKDTKRAYEFLRGRIRSELRRQLDRLFTTNVNDFIEALANGKGLRVHIELVEQTPPVTVPPEEPAVERPPLIVLP